MSCSLMDVGEKSYLITVILKLLRVTLPYTV